MTLTTKPETPPPSSPTALAPKRENQRHLLPQASTGSLATRATASTTATFNNNLRRQHLPAELETPRSGDTDSTTNSHTTTRPKARPAASLTTEEAR